MVVLAGGVQPASVWAQDVEMLGQHYGTRPPAAYYSEIQRNPRAYRPLRGWRPRLSLENAAVGSGIGPSGGAGILGPRQGPVTGTFRLPLLLVVISHLLIFTGSGLLGAAGVEGGLQYVGAPVELNRAHCIACHL